MVHTFNSSMGDKDRWILEFQKPCLQTKQNKEENFCTNVPKRLLPLFHRRIQRLCSPLINYEFLEFSVLTAGSMHGLSSTYSVSVMLLEVGFLGHSSC